MSETGDELLERILAKREADWNGRGKYKAPVAPETSFGNDLPKDWEWASLDQLSEFVTDGDHNPPKRQSSGIPHLTAKHVKNGTVTTEKCTFVSEEGFEQTRSRYEPRAHDVLVTCVGTIGEVALVPERLVFSADRNLAAARLTEDGALPKFVTFALNEPKVAKFLREGSGSTAQPHLYLRDLRKTPIPLPPLPEQRRIVARIEEIFSRLDAGVAALHHAKAQLQRYRQSVLAAAVTGQLTQAWREQNPDTEPVSELLASVLAEREEVWAGRGKYKPPVEVEGDLENLPSGWEWTTLAHLANHIADGTHKTPTYVEDGVAFLSAKDVNGFKLSFDTCRYIPREEHEQLIKRCFPKPGNVLVTKSGTIGRIAVVKTNREFSLFESVANVPVLGQICSEFVAYAAQVGIAGAFGTKNKKGVAVRHLHLEDLRRLPIPLPSLAEQNQIVAEAEARTTAIDHLEAELDRQITHATRLRQSTLSSAFSGKL
ncbi:restriction endonuclease subunit S [Roseibacillus persicicus]|uniref:restriction endonuclease subunit S n=1 Tax=Roseibacillus persicicus TaxID=454148 RepID=UPI00398AA869